ncbi:DUF6502 family protein [Variovorax sp. RT4R15]|uniref:DUF6502 family protein n=1 Tax=Variovorax sp. RT4R15 TaxID=3443737 RepID=UPI003F48A2CD
MENRLGWALAACARILRPVVRLALAMGVQHSHLESVLRDLLLDEARRSWRRTGIEPNISQLSVTTGLSRKAVTARVRESNGALPHTETSAAAKTVTLWLQILADDPERRLLPVVAEGSTLSFEAVARQASRGNVHHRAILDELVRLKMATEQDGRAELKATGFVPVGDLQAMLAFLGDNARDHVLAGVSNILDDEPRMLERAVFAKGLSAQACDRIQQLVRQRWEALHHELTHELAVAVDEADGNGSARMRVGVYSYFEDSAPVSRQSPGPNTLKGGI